MSAAWLDVRQGDAPLIVSIPHAGTELPSRLAGRLVSEWLARKDADWYVDRLYDFAGSLGATVIATRLSRTAADVNRDPAGVPLYYGALNTGLCPTVTFDDEPLYRPGAEPDAAEIAASRAEYWLPYHQAIERQIARLRERHRAIVLYDAHSIRSQVPRLFAGLLPHVNIGTYGGASCAPALAAALAGLCAVGPFSHVVNGRFTGGYITRHYGNPAAGVHAIQIELAMRGYLREPAPPHGPENWPPPYDAAFAAPLRETLSRILASCLQFVS